MNNKQKLLESFVRKPTTYLIEIRDSSMLPKDLRNKKEISITIKPPTTHVLALCASILQEIPENVTSSEDVDLQTVIAYRSQMAKVVMILVEEKTEYPPYYDEFLIKNLSQIELLRIFEETALKCNPAFFLNCIQIAKEGNPMMMRKKRRTNT